MPRRTDISPADKAKIVDLICAEIDNARKRITTEASWARLEEFFYQALLGRNTLDAAQVIAWADAGHPAADRAVRRYGAEALDQQREGELLIQVRAQMVKIMLRPFVPFPRGRHVVANLMRNIWLPTLIQNVAMGTGLSPTRSRSTAAPSVAYFVSLAAKRRGMKLKEQELNRIYGDRHQVAAELEKSMPSTT
jgi:hypothetical protein